MVTVISSDPRERTALTALCEARGWMLKACDGVRSFRHTLRGTWPKVLVTRQALADGYADDVFAALQTAPQQPVKVIVLLAASAPSRVEARQVALGADCVLRDPVRTDVLIEYLARFRASTTTRSRPTRRRPARPLSFAGGTLNPTDRRLQHGSRLTELTPREVALARVLLDAKGDLITYEELYHEILGRHFEGDTSNMRVLLGKLCASAASIGIDLRRWVHVLPKSGYRYAAPTDSNSPRGAA